MILCGTPAHRMKTGVSVFVDARHKSVAMTTSPSLGRAVATSIYKACSIFYESLVTSVQGLWWKQRKRAYFYLCAPTHSLQRSHKISEITGQTSLCESLRNLYQTLRGYRSSQQLSNASRENEDRCVNFRQHAPQIGYRSNVPGSSHCNLNTLL